MAKPIKPRAELESMIAAEVRRRPHCEGFLSIFLHEILDARSCNWTLGAVNYGDAGRGSCDAALRDIIPKLQEKYDLASD